MTGSLTVGGLLFIALIIIWLVYALPDMARQNPDENAYKPQPQLPERDVTARVQGQKANARFTPSTTIVREVPMKNLSHNPVPPSAKELMMRRRRRTITVALSVLTLVFFGLWIANLVTFWLTAVALFLTAGYLAALTVTDRRLNNSKATHAQTLDIAPRRVHARRSASAMPAWLVEENQELPQPVSSTGEWTPIPVPAPAYTLRGEVEDLAERHDVYARSVYARPLLAGSLSDGFAFEAADVEEKEAEADLAAEVAQENRAVSEIVDFDLDDVLARRRA